MHTFHITILKSERSNPKDMFQKLVHAERTVQGGPGVGSIGHKQSFKRIAAVDTLKEARALIEKLHADRDPRICAVDSPAGCVVVRNDPGVAFIFFGETYS